MDRERRLKANNDFLKQEIVTDDSIEQTRGYAIGWDTSEEIAQAPLPKYDAEEIALPPLFSFEDLTSRVESSDLPPVQKERTRENLNRLSSAVDRIETIDLKTTRGLLEEIGTTMPELREPLWYWLTETVQVPNPVKIVARKLLQA